MKVKSKGSTVKHCKMATLKEIDRAEPLDGVFTARAEILVLLKRVGMSEDDIEETMQKIDNINSVPQNDKYNPEFYKLYEEIKKDAEKAKTCREVGQWEEAELLKGESPDDFQDNHSGGFRRKKKGIFDVDIIFNQGLDYNNFGKQDKAIKAFEMVVKLEPKSPTAYYNMGLAYARKGLIDKGIYYYTKAISIASRYTSAYINRGNLYLDTKKYSKALSDFNRVIKLSPKSSVAYNNRGLVNYRRKQYKKAVADYNKAIKVDLTYSKAYYNLALAFATLGNYNKAWQNVHKVIQLDRQIDPAFLCDLRKWSGKNELTSKEELLNKELYDLFNKEDSDAGGLNFNFRLNQNVEDIDNDKLTPADIPLLHAEWECISKFALTFNGYERHGSLEACADIANAQCNSTLTELRTCLFFDQRRWHHFGENPNNETMLYIRDIVERIRTKVVAREFS